MQPFLVSHIPRKLSASVAGSLMFSLLIDNCQSQLLAISLEVTIKAKNDINVLVFLF